MCGCGCGCVDVQWDQNKAETQCVQLETKAIHHWETLGIPLWQPYLGAPCDMCVCLCQDVIIDKHNQNQITLLLKWNLEEKKPSRGQRSKEQSIKVLKIKFYYFMTPF